jgi:two-component system, cell cycle sensor histidine kinase and response regulator CckA
MGAQGASDAKRKKSETVILIAEDEPVVRNLIRSLVQAEGYSFLVAADGEEALVLSRAYPDEIHVLLTDVKMPKLDGITLADRLMQDRPEIRVLVMSGEASGEIRKSKMGLPFLKKPFVPAVFRDKLESVIAGPKGNAFRAG